MTQPEELYERFDVDPVEMPLVAQYNITPSKVEPVVVKQSPNHLELMRWGLIPSWAKDDKLGYKLINARAETLMFKRVFRTPLQQGRRCLIPADGFFEWKQEKDGKQPYYIQLKNKALFAFAGLYDVWQGKNGQEVKSYTIITTTPNSLVKPIHDRMPVILHPENEEVWLNPEEDDLQLLLHLLKPYPAEEMDTYKVTRAVNNPRAEGPQLTEAILKR